MKQLFQVFLMCLMLMPSLACAMPLCGDQAQQTKVGAKAHPCAGHARTSGDASLAKKGSLTLIVDCMGVDLKAAENVDAVTGPQFVVALDWSMPPAYIEGVPSLPHSVKEATGPPFEHPGLPLSRLSILHTTQRLRI